MSFLTYEQVATRWLISKRTVQEMAAMKRFKVFKPTPRIALVPLSEVERVETKHTIKAVI